MHGLLAVEAGKLQHILPEETDGWTSQTDSDVRKATDDDAAMLTAWKKELEIMLQEELKVKENSAVMEGSQDNGEVFPIENLLFREEVDIDDCEGDKAEDIDPSTLNEEQR